MTKITNSNGKRFSAKVKEISLLSVKVVFVTAAILLGMKWVGDLLEIVSDHVSVGAGLFVVFAAACFFIHIDSKHSVELSDDRRLFAHR